MLTKRSKCVQAEVRQGLSSLIAVHKSLYKHPVSGWLYLIISQQTVQPSQFLLGSPRFSLKISNTDQNEIGIGKIRIFTSFCDDVCLHRILRILMPEHHIECSQLKPIFQKLKKLQEIYRKIKYLYAKPPREATKRRRAICVYIYVSHLH